MEPFETIGRALRERWARTNFDEERFPELAVEALERAGVHEHCSQSEVLRWIAQTPVLPAQGDASFGQPPVNLYRDEQLFIEALFWVDGTTSIHQHAFSGAFCVLEGSSVHAVHAFSQHERVNDQLLLGELRIQSVELLRPGQVRPIKAGRDFIHALFHLERPTLSLVVRTNFAPAHPIQYSYQAPGLALDPFYRPASLSKRLAVLDMLLVSAHPELRTFVEQMVEAADAVTLIRVLQRVNEHTSGFALVGPLLDRARERHGDLIPRLRETLSRDRTAALLTHRRKTVTSPNLRFLLGLLLNVAGPKRILPLVQARFPDQNPVQSVLGWVRELNAISAEDGNALGLELDEDAFWILERLLEGKTESAMIAEAQRTRGTLGPAEIAKHCFTWPFNSVMGRLIEDDQFANR